MHPRILSRTASRRTSSAADTTEHDDDHINLQQRMAVSKEMTNLLERRLKEMAEIGTGRTVYGGFCGLVSMRQPYYRRYSTKRIEV